MKNLNLLRKLWMLPLFCLALNLHAQGVARTKPSTSTQRLTTTPSRSNVANRLKANEYIKKGMEYYRAKNYTQAASYLEKAANLGEFTSQSVLGSMYMNGEETFPDDEKKWEMETIEFIYPQGKAPLIQEVKRGGLTKKAWESFVNYLTNFIHNSNVGRYFFFDPNPVIDAPLLLVDFQQLRSLDVDELDDLINEGQLDHPHVEKMMAHFVGYTGRVPTDRADSPEEATYLQELRGDYHKS